MLDEVFIKRITDLAMATYASRHEGRPGISKADAIEAVMYYGGNMDDVRAVMTEGAKRILPESALKHIEF